MKTSWTVITLGISFGALNKTIKLKEDDLIYSCTKDEEKLFYPLYPNTEAIILTINIHFSFFKILYQVLLYT